MQCTVWLISFAKMGSRARTENNCCQRVFGKDNFTHYSNSASLALPMHCNGKSRNARKESEQKISSLWTLWVHDWLSKKQKNIWQAEAKILADCNVYGCQLPWQEASCGKFLLRCWIISQTLAKSGQEDVRCGVTRWEMDPPVFYVRIGKRCNKFDKSVIVFDCDDKNAKAVPALYEPG